MPGRRGTLTTVGDRSSDHPYGRLLLCELQAMTGGVPILRLGSAKGQAVGVHGFRSVRLQITQSDRYNLSVR